MGSGLAASFGKVEVCFIEVSGQYHVARSIGDVVIWVRGNIVEELCDGFIRVFHGHRLLGSNLFESNEEYGIDSSDIVQQGTHYSLNTIYAFVIKFGAVIGVGCILSLVTIFAFEMFVQ